jgi:ferric-dicitrate binding protein FerR (iron transport regulator)
MKKVYVLGTLALSLFIVILSGDAFSAQSGSPYTAKVVSTKGYVDVRYAGTDAFVALSPGGAVGTGDVIQTDSEGKIELKLPDGSKLLIGENSRVLIKELGQVEVTKATKSAFELFKGKIRAIVTPFVSKDSAFDVETNNATVGVRGTDFGETYDPNRDITYVLEMTGTVSVSLKHFPEKPLVIIEEGHEAYISGRNMPEEPSVAKEGTIDEFVKGMEVTESGGPGGSNPIPEGNHGGGGTRGGGGGYKGGGGSVTQ